MNLHAPLLAATVLMTALAGCSDSPPSGEFTFSRMDAKADGTAAIDYQAFNDPISGSTNPDDPQACLQDNLPETLPVDRCEYPFSDFVVSFPAGTYSDPDPAQGYKVFLVMSDGELEIGALQDDGAGGLATANRYDEDLSDRAARMELRMGNAIIATATSSEGATNAFQLSDNLTAVAGEGTYKGKDLEFTVSGLPAGIAAVGWLITEDADGIKEHAASFNVANGVNTFTAGMNIAEYAELHIHLGGSKLNVAIADLGTA